MAFPALICVKWKTVQFLLVIEERDNDDEPDNESEISDDSDENEI